jgi:hypothetical protein
MMMMMMMMMVMMMMMMMMMMMIMILSRADNLETSVPACTPDSIKKNQCAVTARRIVKKMISQLRRSPKFECQYCFWGTSAQAPHAG